MRLQPLEIDSQNGKIDIDTTKFNRPFVVVVSEGKARLTELPAHGETRVVTHQGKVKRVKFDEGEEF